MQWALDCNNHILHRRIRSYVYACVYKYISAYVHAPLDNRQANACSYCAHSKHTHYHTINQIPFNCYKMQSCLIIIPYSYLIPYKPTHIPILVYWRCNILEPFTWKIQCISNSFSLRESTINYPVYFATNSHKIKINHP